jgi:hypothetical protein
MTWYWWSLATFVALYAAGRLVALVRGTPNEPDDIRYWYGSPLAWAIAKSRRSAGNWCVTIGRVTHVRRHQIEGFQVAHELRHSQQAHRMSVPVFLARWLWQCARYGYRKAPLEMDAERYEQLHAAEFKDRRRA